MPSHEVIDILITQRNIIDLKISNKSVNTSQNE